MGTTVSTGGASYTVPAYNDTGWAQGQGNLSSYLIAIASTKLDTSGGTFTLTGAVNFGSSYGIQAAWMGNHREVYIAGTPSGNYTGSLTLVNLVNSYPANGSTLSVYLNGLLQDVTLDYSETSTMSITFNASLNTGDRISLRWR